jgi:hypothetical protein
MLKARPFFMVGYAQEIRDSIPGDFGRCRSSPGQVERLFHSHFTNIGDEGRACREPSIVAGIPHARTHVVLHSGGIPWDCWLADFGL